MRAIASVTPSEPAPAACPGLAHLDMRAGPPADLPQPGRALVVVGSGPGTAADPSGSRPSAAFLAQLIATAQRAPQTRRRRRAEPNEVSSIYAAVSAPAARMGRAICRSM
jgi:hypothetical protein